MIHKCIIRTAPWFERSTPCGHSMQAVGLLVHAAKSVFCVPLAVRIHEGLVWSNRDNGLGFYRFSYNGRAYVGVMAQEVQVVMPDAVSLGPDGTLRVHYEMLGLRFQTYDQWIGSGARIPVTVRTR
jgi:hypothetical protein